MLCERPDKLCHKPAPQHDCQDRHPSPCRRGTRRKRGLLQFRRTLQTEVYSGGRDAGNNGRHDALLEIEFGDSLFLVGIAHLAFLEPSGDTNQDNSEKCNPNAG